MSFLSEMSVLSALSGLSAELQKQKQKLCNYGCLYCLHCLQCLLHVLQWLCCLWAMYIFSVFIWENVNINTFSNIFNYHESLIAKFASETPECSSLTRMYSLMLTKVWKKTTTAAPTITLLSSSSPSKLGQNESMSHIIFTHYGHILLRVLKNTQRDNSEST